MAVEIYKCFCIHFVHHTLIIYSWGRLQIMPLETDKGVLINLISYLYVQILIFSNIVVWRFERLYHVQRRIQMMSTNLEKNYRGVIILNYPHRRYFDPEFLLVFNNLKCILGHIHKQRILSLSDWDCRFQNHRCMAAYQDYTMLFIISCYVMMTSSNGNIIRVTGLLCGEFTGHRWIPSQIPVTRSFDVFFDLRLNKLLSKQSRRWWFEMPLRSLWHKSQVYRDRGVCINVCECVLTLISIMIHVFTIHGPLHMHT